MYQVQDGYSQYKEIDLAARTAAASPLNWCWCCFLA